MWTTDYSIMLIRPKADGNFTTHLCHGAGEHPKCFLNTVLKRFGEGS